MKIKVSKHKLKIHCRGSRWGSRTQQRAYCLRYAHSQHIESHLGKKQPQPKLCRQILDKIFISSRHKFMPSRPLLISPIHRVNSSSCQVISLSRRVISSCRLYYLQVHYSYILQWFFNSSCRTSTHRSLYPYILAHRLDTRSLVTSKAEWPQGWE